MSRGIRTFSSFTRSVLRSKSTLSQESGPIHIQHVRLLKPKKWLTPRKLVVGMTLGGIVWLQLPDYDGEKEKVQENKPKRVSDAVQKIRSREAQGIAGEGEVEGGHEEVNTTHDEETEEVDEDDLVPEELPEDAWFIPLSLPKKLPPTFYKGSDPEWQAFITFAKDIDRGRRVRRELATMIGTQVASARFFQHFLGTPIKTGHHWFDFDFPEGPPIQFERMGLEITDDYVAITVRPVDGPAVQRIRSLLWPSAAGISLWASVSTFTQLQMAKLRKALNLPEPQTPKLPGHHHAVFQIQQANGGQTPNLPGTRGKKNPETTTAGQSEDMAAGDKQWFMLPSAAQPSDEMRQASKVFKRTLAQTKEPPFLILQDGSFMISGLLEVYGPRGICTLEVTAGYDPRDSQFHGVVAGIRRMKTRKQAPKG